MFVIVNTPIVIRSPCKFRRMCGAYHDAFQLTIVLTFWGVAAEFGESLKLSTGDDKWIDEIESGNKIFFSMPWARVLKKYQSIKRLANLLNSVVGVNFTFFLVVSILDYAISFDEIFVEGTGMDWTGFSGVVFYFLSTCSILGVSAEACRQVS